MRVSARDAPHATPGFPPAATNRVRPRAEVAAARVHHRRPGAEEGKERGEQEGLRLQHGAVDHGVHEHADPCDPVAQVGRRSERLHDLGRANVGVRHRVESGRILARSGSVERGCGDLARRAVRVLEVGRAVHVRSEEHRGHERKRWEDKGKGLRRSNPDAAGGLVVSQACGGHHAAAGPAGSPTPRSSAAARSSGSTSALTLLSTPWYQKSTPVST